LSVLVRMPGEKRAVNPSALEAIDDGRLVHVAVLPEPVHSVTEVPLM
jgi:hypothetical protein